MVKFSKQTASEIHRAIVAYSAFHEYLEKGEMERAFIYGRMIRETVHIFEAVELNVQSIIDRVNHEALKK